MTTPLNPQKYEGENPYEPLAPDELVLYVRTSGNNVEGRGALAELTKRQTEEMRKSSRTISRLTIVLIVLTLALVGLTIALLAAAN